jgi:hypothetical protein
VILLNKNVRRITSFGFCMLFLMDFSMQTHAQTGDITPVVFDQFFQNYYLINPASSDSTGKIQVNIGNRSLIGLFDGVNRLYVDGNVRINHHTAMQYSRLGALVIAYNDGAFINRTRAYLRYSWSTSISERASISAGISAGMVKYTFLASQAGGGGSSTSFDGNAGLWYIRPKLKIGISYQQFTRSELTPVNQTFLLTPYINVNAVYASYLSAHVLLTTHVFYRYESGSVFDIQAAPVFLFNDLFEAGINLRYKRGVAILFGLKSIHVGTGNIRFMGSFMLSTRKLANTLDNAFELSAGYSF